MATRCRWFPIRLIALLVVAAALAVWSAPANAEDFNRTLPAVRGTRLDVRLYGGSIAVHGWQKDEVRVRATHFATDEIDVRASGQAMTVRARARVGTPHAIDLNIDVPQWMAVTLAGTYIDVAVEGTRADVTAETVRGDVKVKGAAGAIVLKSIDGEVVLEGGEGRADLTAVNLGVRVTGWSGDLVAQTVNGNVKLDAVRSNSVAVGTMGGDIAWSGTMAADGRYRFATHEGDIDVAVPAAAAAEVSVRLFDGHFRSLVPAQLPDERARGKRFSFALGTGGSHLDLETFRGTISLRPVAK